MKAASMKRHLSYQKQAKAMMMVAATPGGDVSMGFDIGHWRTC